MTNEFFQISIDSHLAKELRKVVNGQRHFSVKQRKILRINGKKKEYPTWSLVCAIMDRLDDTIDYLNHLRLNTGTYKRSAFDFFDFITQSTVILDCVDTLAKIYEVSFIEENKSTAIFNKIGKNGSGTDKKYFAYLRSLCSVHPIETSYYEKTYQDSDFESSPFVIWNDESIWNREEGDLIARVYTNKNDYHDKRVSIKILEIFSYVKNRYHLLEKVIEAIKNHHAETTQFFIEKEIKSVNDFDSFTNYLYNLKKEACTRFGDDYSHEYDFVISLLGLKLSNCANRDRYVKYCDAFRYAISFEHNGVQNMNFDNFDNNGIKYPERNLETTLFYELHPANSNSEDLGRYRYNVEKAGYLNYDSGRGDKQWAYSMIDQAKPFFEKYVTFEDAQGDFEHYALVQIALYFDCLENKCILNKNIPNDVRFRDRILSDDEMVNLLVEEPVDRNAGRALIDWIEPVYIIDDI